MIHRFTLFFLALIAIAATVHAQQKPPFYDEIQNYKKLDSTIKLPRKPVLFTGSSSFRLWGDVQQAFPGYIILNRAFGGATIPDVIRYVNEVILPYKPKQVVIYCGDNDLASSDNITADSVYNRFVTLFNIIRNDLRKTSIVFVAIKPSPSRERLMPKIESANAQIKAFLATKKRTGFVDIYQPMLGADGKPRKELFKEDMLHMNAAGYAIWTTALQPYLKK